MTELGKIKAMNAIEMAEFLDEITSNCWELGKRYEAEESNEGICENCPLYKLCHKSLTIIEGLESEVE